MATKENFYRAVSLSTLLLLLFFVSGLRAAHARTSREWADRLLARTTTLWIEAQFLGDLVLNARGELNVTWLERGLINFYNNDMNVDEWVVEGLNYYFSSHRETRARIRGRDVLALNFRAVKHWSFDPTMLTVGDYTITPEDIFTRRSHWEGPLPPGTVGTVIVAVPSLRPGQTVELRYEDAVAQFVVPRTR